MKRFHFPLTRVLDWRRTEERIEEAKLQQARAEVRKIEAQIAARIEQRAASERALIGSGSATGAELAVLASFKKFIAGECSRFDQLAEVARNRAALQARAVAQARGKVRLLEKLEQQKRSAWVAAYVHDMDAQAEEAHIAKIVTDKKMAADRLR